MLIVLREAFYFTQRQFQPLALIALVYTVPSLFIEQSGLLSTETGINVIALFTVMCLNLLPFASAMLYINAISQGNPISIGQALTQGISRLGWLIVLNVLLGAIVMVGFLMLIVPGLFFAYKLLFAELYLLLHQETPMNALKSSYRATTGLFNQIAPPLAVWFSATLVTSLLLSELLGGTADLVSAGIYTLVMMLFSIYGWALIYRLYQRYLEAQVPDPDEP